MIEIFLITEHPDFFFFLEVKILSLLSNKKVWRQHLVEEVNRKTCTQAYNQIITLITSKDNIEIYRERHSTAF